MRDRPTGWTALAMLVVVRVLTADREAAGQVVLRPDITDDPPPRRIVVSLADRKLAVMDGRTVVRVFRVAVGAPATPSPVGRFRIVNRLQDPTYYGGGKVIAPGPANPLGTRWMGLDLAGYGIHGTDKPDSIGKARSHGCIRLRNRDVEELFALAREGDLVELHAASTPEVERLFAQSAAAVPAAAVVSLAGIPSTGRPAVPPSPLGARAAAAAR